MEVIVDTKYRQILVDDISDPAVVSGLVVLAGSVTNTGESDISYTISRIPIKYLILAIGIYEGGATIGQNTEAGVVFTVPAGKTLQYTVIGSKTDQFSTLTTDTDIVVTAE